MTGIKLPLVAFLNVISYPQALSAEDSVNRLVYARNRVRTVTVRAKNQPIVDTVSFMEFDRRGNRTVLAGVPGGVRHVMHYDKQNHLIETRLVPASACPLGFRTVYDPNTQLYTTFATVGAGAAEVLWQQTQRYRSGDTVAIQAIFKAVPGMENVRAAYMDASRRLVLRVYPAGKDTVRSEIVTYDAIDRPIEFSQAYKVQRDGRVVENGRIDYAADPESKATDQPEAKVTVATLLRRSRQQRGRYVVQNRYAYNAKGQLSKTVSLMETLKENPFADPKSTQMVNQIISQTIECSRLPDGRFLRQERTTQLRPGTTDAIASMTNGAVTLLRICSQRLAGTQSRAW